VDREIHIEKLRREIADVTGGEMVNGRMGDCDSKVEEAFLEHVLALETHGFVCPFDAMTTTDSSCRRRINSTMPR
jgi:hypothetical protein